MHAQEILGNLQHTLHQLVLNISAKYMFTFIDFDVMFQNIIPDNSSSIT